MVCLPSESDTERELVESVVAAIPLTGGPLVIGVLLVAGAVVGLVVWLLVHAAAATSELSPAASTAAIDVVGLFWFHCGSPSSRVAGDFMGQRAV
jgi:hypothetical protein